MDAVSVTCGEFVYRDTLFVDVGGGGKRHPRAAEAELESLLNGKAQQKDPVAHWYEAQLIHYGLQRSKEKNTAKVRLQQALGQGKLKVPPHISEMEMQMRKEYAAAVRKANKADSGNPADDAATKMAKKRKNDEVATESLKRTKTSLSVGGIAINIEHNAHGQAKVTSTKSGEATAAKTPKKMPASKVGGIADSGSASKPTKTPKAKAAPVQQQANTPPANTPARKPKSSASASASKSTAVSVKAEMESKVPPKLKAEPK
ncbi:hypothetical protein B0A55_10311 [Friedmanniomyces simplex]|uniref:Uncharacterized protein n=1 Tax=Friedmanniomyces simplex TaxID=329884 RepID=A0A4U0WTC6_9PEZI|nr:hypothetical protein B0A55_10311 [Friedmanniomyces simplex]